MSGEVATPKRPRGRPVGTTRGQMVRVDIKLSPELLARAKAEAARVGITFSAYVRSCLDGDLHSSNAARHVTMASTP